MAGQGILPVCRVINMKSLKLDGHNSTVIGMETKL